MIETIEYNWTIGYIKDFHYLGLHFKAGLQKNRIDDSYVFTVWNWDDDSSDDIFSIEWINKSTVNIYHFNEYLDRFLDWIS